MIFQLTIADEIPFMKKIIIKSSYPGALKSYNFIWNAFFNPPAMQSLQRVSCFILRVVFP